VKDGDAGQTREARVWDVGVRLFHWLLVAFVSASWLLGQFGPAIMTLHFQSGYVIIGLLAFRLIWGLAGPRPARFASFLAGPRAVWAYARTLPRRAPSFWPGHNPLGGWAVAAMLLLLAAQVATGLFADPEDFINQGPLAASVEPATRHWASAWHARLANALLALVILHVAAIAFYRFWKREDLVRPMLTGRKTVRRDEADP